MSNQPTGAEIAKGVRWWPAWIVVALWAVSVSAVWFSPEVQRQDRFLRCVVISLVAAALMLLWALLISRFSLKTRLKLLGGTIVAGVAAAALFEIRGVTGDLFPIVEFRWKKRAELAQVNPSTTTTKSMVATAGDYPQFQGPNRDGRFPKPPFTLDLTTNPPKELWRKELGPAWSGFAVAQGRAVTLEQRGEQETIVCYDLATGAPLWSHGVQARYATTIAGEGPRGTPTLVEGKVVVLGATGMLVCVELTTGKPLWTVDLRQELGAGLPEWGFSASPLVHNGKVIVPAGGSDNRALVAYGLADGKLVWGTGGGGAGYSSAMALELAGREQIVCVQGGTVRGVDPADGAPLWEHSWPGSYPKVSVPVRTAPDELLISAGYGVGSELLKFSLGEQGKVMVERAWKSIALKSKFANFFVEGGYAYGLDDGIMVCVALADGKRVWKNGRYGHGQMLMIGGKLLVMAESGELVVVAPNPERHEELGRLPVLNGKTWNPPALAGRYLLVRNDKEAVCLRFETGAPPAP